jgi:hypothetical protein
MLLDLGFRYDSSVFPFADSLYGMPGPSAFRMSFVSATGRRLIEFPITTTELFGAISRSAAAAISCVPLWLHALGHAPGEPREQQARGRVHPPWEIDPGQPRVKTAADVASAATTSTSRRTEAKLRRLLRDFRFAPMRDLLDVAMTCSSGVARRRLVRLRRLSGLPLPGIAQGRSRR